MRIAKALLIALLAVIAVQVVRSLDAAPATAAKPAAAAKAKKSSSHINVYNITPTTLQPTATGPDGPDVVMEGPKSHWNGLLLVFLPGTGGEPNCCEHYMHAAASLGYHVIGLTYDNEKSVNSRCKNSLNCYGMVRDNEFDGDDATPVSAFPSTDGVDLRLASVLRYLNRHHRHEGWKKFMFHNWPSWSKIVMSGHSQGGGEAVFIGTVKKLKGVVALSSPLDTNSNHVPAAWLANVPIGRTPLSHIVGFVHEGDAASPRIAADWEEMEMTGPVTFVDGAAPPYGNSHELVSNAPLPNVRHAQHNSTAVDAATPMCPNGTPEYTPVWDYALVTAGGLHTKIPAPAC